MSTPSGSPSASIVDATEVSRLESYVRAAAKLRLEIAPFQRDQADMLDGNRVLYCVDTNIVHLFIAPIETGRLEPGGGDGYGMVFPDDDEASSGALAVALSRFIFYSLTQKLDPSHSGQLPLILLTGHDAETRRLYDNIAQRAEDHGKEVSRQRDRLVEILGGLSGIADPDRRADVLGSEADSLFDLLFSDSDPRELLERLSKLIGEGRVGRVSSFTNRLVADIEGRPLAREILGAMFGPRTVSEQVAESSYRLAWEGRLTAANRRKSESRRRPDVAALARLEFINARLRGTNHSLALITGDETMHRAAAGHRPFGGAGPSFATLYLRHPRAFLAADEVLLPSRAMTADASTPSLGLMSNWLDALLARFVKDHRLPERGNAFDVDDRLAGVAALFAEPAQTSSRLRQRVETVLSFDPRAADRLKDEWRNHVSILREEHSAPSALARREVARILGKAQDGDHITALKEIDEVLSARSERTWKSFFEAIVRTGYDILTVSPSDRPRRRNAPPLDFSSLPETLQFVRLVIESDYPPKDPEIFQAKLDAIQTEDPTGYAHLLAFAALFATAGRWHVASLLSGQAISIAKRIAADEVLSRQSRITGREAYYFTAVARRMSARSLRELDNLENLIEDAHLALAKDLLRDDPPRVGPERFESESRALDLTRLLFRYFLSKDGDSVVQSDELRDLLNRLVLLFNKTEEMEPGWTRNIVQRHVLTNVFMTCAVLEQFPTSDLEKRFMVLRRLADFFDQSFRKQTAADAGSQITETRLVSIVRLYASAKFGTPDPKKVRRLMAEVSDFDRRAADDRAQNLMPYDSDRFQLLLAGAKRSLVRSQIND